MRSGQLGHLAGSQLAAWEAIATAWPLVSAGRSAAPGGPGIVRVAECERCGRGVLLQTDQAGREYRYTQAERLAHVVLHLRTHHEDLDPGR
ncbi:MAG TPA: hypothetical protein VEH31_43835 [Streptosporangiaceae bacterium]|nr:hypothetical protein [Streptosporangiaceae bacterium]